MAAFEMAMEPAEALVFQGPAAMLQMGNVLGRRVAFKVKCTDNNLFKIDPAIGIINPEEGVAISITFTGEGPVPEQSFSVAYIFADEVADPKNAWAAATGEEPSKTLPVHFI